MLFSGLCLLLLANFASASHALLSSWMSRVQDNTLVTQLTIPGLYSIQSTSALYAALEQGIRAIDVRITPQGTDFNLSQDDVPEDAAIALSTVFDKSLQFLRAHPTETLLFIVRSEDFIADDLLEFLYRYRAFVYADDWTDGVAKMKDLRGKIWLITDVDEMEGVAPYVSWEKNSGSTEGVHAQGAYMVEDLQKVPLSSYEDMIESKLRAITNNMKQAFTNLHEMDLFLTYTTMSGNSKYSCEDFMDGIWPSEGLHSQLATFLDQASLSKSTLAGIVIIEWNTDSSELTEKLLQGYLTSAGPLRLQLD